MSSSEYINIQDCSIRLLALTHSYNNFISKCEIDDVMNDFSRANTFQDLHFPEKPEKLKNELLKSSISIKLHYLSFLSIITIAILVTWRLWEYSFVQALIFLLITVSAALFYIGENLKSYLNMRKCAPNQFL